MSICIPAYKRADFLQRLLDSIAIQQYKDFEVIITDDSPNGDIKELCVQYADKFTLHYHKNKKSLGTPENWNESIRHANGQWIKLMHDDDWFAGADSLQIFSETISKNPEGSFIFSAYQNVYFDKDHIKNVFLNSFRYKKLRNNPVTLFSSNVIGPPSVVIYKNGKEILFDKQLKWFVDIDFYIRYLKDNKPVYISKPLVNVGIGKEQVTMDCFRQRKIEIPEGFYLLNKTGVHSLRNLLLYDAWWRLMRNLEIKNVDDIHESGYTGKIPAVIRSMISWQQKLPSWLLKTGISSKTFMFLNYISNLKRIKD